MTLNPLIASFDWIILFHIMNFHLVFILTVAKTIFTELSPISCPPDVKGSRGTIVNFYEDGLLDKTSLHDIEFLKGRYLANKHLGTTDGVLTLNYDSGWPATKFSY